MKRFTTVVTMLATLSACASTGLLPEDAAELQRRQNYVQLRIAEIKAEKAEYELIKNICMDRGFAFFGRSKAGVNNTIEFTNTCIKKADPTYLRNLTPEDYTIARHKIIYNACIDIGITASACAILIP